MEQGILERAIRIADPRDMPQNVEVIHYDVDGSELSRCTLHNIVTTVGKAKLANYALGLDSQTAWTQMELGSSNQAPAAGDTGVVSVISATGMAKKTADSLSISGNSTMVLDATWTNASGGNVTVQEVAVMNTSGTPRCLARSLTNQHVVGNGQSLRIVYNIPIA